MPHPDNIPRPDHLVRAANTPDDFDTWAWGSWDGRVIMWADDGGLWTTEDATVRVYEQSLVASVPVGKGAVREFFFLRNPGGWVFDGTDYGPIPGWRVDA